MENVTLEQYYRAKIDRAKSHYSWTSIFFLIGGIFILIQVLEKASISIAFFGLFALGAILLIVKPRIGILYYISVCILSTDTPPINTIEQLISIHTVSVGNFAIMPLWTIFLLLFLLSRFALLKKSIPFIPRFDNIMFYLGILYLIGGAIGILNLLNEPRIYISDASYYINMATGYLAVRIFFQREKDLIQLIKVLLSCMVVWAVSGIIFYILGIGEITPALVKPIVDSCRVLFPLLTLVGIAIYYTKGIQFSVKTQMAIIAFAGVFNIFTYASRGNMILLTFGILLLLFLLRSQNSINYIAFRKLVRIIIPSVLLTVLVLMTMHYVRPGSLEYIVWKINSIRAISLFDTGMRGITSAEVRWLSFLNIVSHLWDTGNILWGVGLGGYFTDDYIPFASFLLDGSAFKNEWILQNKLYKPHGAQLVILLKMGVIGAIVYLGLLLIFFIRSWKATVKITSSPLWHSVCAACVAFLPLLSYKNFTSKIQIFMGITMAVIVNIVAIHTRNFRNRRITL